jgi:hypothetical protein
MEKSVFITLFIAGIGAFAVPIFIHQPIVDWIAKPLGILLMVVSVVYLIAGDVLMRKFTHQKPMTAEELLDKKRQEYKMKIQEADWQLQLEQKKAEIEKIKNDSKVSGEKKKDILDNMSDFMIKTKGP